MNESKLIQDLTLYERRRVLKYISTLFASPMTVSLLPESVVGRLMGTAFAEELSASKALYFIEINFRDQWDFGHVFVPPSLASNPDLKRGMGVDTAAMFYRPEELTKCSNGVYLTPDSISLQKHVDTIAMIETCELPIGKTHGHEAACPMRSPGRIPNQKSGYLPMWELDFAGQESGNEFFYGATPTPAVLHNYFTKLQNKNVGNGIVFKGVSRLQTAYHFAAQLKGAQLDRFRNRDLLLSAFQGKTPQSMSLSSRESAAVLKLLKSLDSRYFAEFGYKSSVQKEHDLRLDEAKRRFSSLSINPSLPLTQEEIAYWSEGVPAQVIMNEDEFGEMSTNIWEQCAYAYKLIASGALRTVALEFDYLDWHSARELKVLKTQGLQTALPLGRLIEKLKSAGLYDQTLIAIYTTDGSRGTASTSVGDSGKNAVMLAGGMIRGGYYGDVSVASNQNDGHLYAYHAPDLLTGMAGPGHTNTEGRIDGSVLWMTVAKALGVPKSITDDFEPVRGVRAADFMLNV